MPSPSSKPSKPPVGQGVVAATAPDALAVAGASGAAFAAIPLTGAALKSTVNTVIAGFKKVAKDRFLGDLRFIHTSQPAPATPRPHASSRTGTPPCVAGTEFLLPLGAFKMGMPSHIILKGDLERGLDVDRALDALAEHLRP